MRLFKNHYVLPYSLEEIWDWHARAGAFERLKPVFADFQVVYKDSSLSIGSKVHLREKVGPFKVDWILEHVDMEAYAYFVDRQIKGPFGTWEHSHLFESTLNGGCLLTDEILYDGFLATFFNPLIESQLKRLFHYRKGILENDLKVKHLHKIEHIIVHLMDEWKPIGSAFTSLLQSYGSTTGSSHIIVHLDQKNSRAVIEDRQKERIVTLEYDRVLFGQFPAEEPQFWIARDDVLYSIYHAIMDEKLRGNFHLGASQHTFPYPLIYREYHDAKERLLGYK